MSGDWPVLCWVLDGFPGPKRRRHEGGGLLTECGGEPGKGAAPAEGVRLSLQLTDGAHADPGPAGQRLLGEPLLAA